MRRINDRLDKFLVPLAQHLVQQDRNDHRRRKAEHQRQKTERQRIAHDRPEVIGIEKINKVFEPYPFAAPNPLARREILKGNLHAVHRIVLEHEIDQKDGQQEQIQFVVAFYLNPSLAFHLDYGLIYPGIA